MTRPGDLSADVRRFVERHIEGVKHLEILMHMQRAPSRFWNAMSVATLLHVSERDASSVLEALARGGLLDVRIASAVLYRFSPATPGLARGTRQVAKAYTEHRDELLALLIAP